MLFNSLEDLIGFFNRLKGQGMSICCDVLPVIFYESSEVVFPIGAPWFNDLVITALMEFFIIKVGAIQCFQDSHLSQQSSFVAGIGFKLVLRHCLHMMLSQFQLVVGRLVRYVNFPTVLVSFSLIS